tara:strand:+ start:546 stop:2735 length:2190 start_codon:yes stop_codon:yes gene_type:complete
MPKIPSFISQVRMTSDTGQQAPVIQQDLSNTMASSLAPAVKAISDFKVKEKLIQDKTEALDLENQSIIELNTVTQEASKLMNKEKANLYLMTESARIRDNFGSKASSSSVKNLFQNNYLLEEQKQIYKVDNAVYKNIVQNSNDQKEIKYERLVRDAMFGENPLSRETIYNSLIQLENDDLVQDEDTRAKNIALIPRKLDYFSAKYSIDKDPVNALKQLSDPKQFINLDIKSLTSLKNEARQLASPEIRDNANNYLAALKVGKKADIDEEAVKVVLGKNYYQSFKEEQSGLQRASYFAEKIMMSKKGDEEAIANMFPINKGSEKLDIELQQGLKQLITTKQKMFTNDPAQLILGYNPTVKNAYNDYVSEDNSKLQQEKFKVYANSMKQAQIEMGKRPLEVKLMTKGQATETIASITDETKSWKEQKAILGGIAQTYGKENSSIIFNQLKSEKLPEHIIVAMSTNNQFLNESILSSGKTKDLENLVKAKLPPHASLNKIKNLVAEKLDTYENIINSQPEGSVSKEEQILAIRDTLYKATLDRVNKGESYETAGENVTKQFLEDYNTSQKTYFIPKDVNGEPVSFENVINKADRVKLAVETTDYMERFFKGDFAHYARSMVSAQALPDNIKMSDEKTFNAYVKDKMTNSIKKHSKWLLNSSSTGIVLYVELANGTVPVINSEGQKVEFFFTKQKEQDPSIKNSTESFEPGTGRKLPDFEEPSVSGFSETTMR